MLVNQKRPATLSAGIVFRVYLFWSKSTGSFRFWPLPLKVRLASRVEIRTGQISIGMYQVPIKIPKFNRHVPIKILKFNRHVPIKIIFFAKHLPIKEMRRHSNKFTKDHTTHNTIHTTKDATFWMQAFRGEDQKSHSWRQKWATGWPSSTSPTRFRGSSKSRIQWACM